MRMICGEKRRALRAIAVVAPILALAVAPSPRSTVHASTSFTRSTTLTTAAGPTSIATGDFNGDGKTDLAVSVLGNGGGVDIYLGRGDGTFNSPAFLATGAGAAKVAVADLNSDGKPDLAVANAQAGTVSILYGNGNGTFHAGPSLTPGPDTETVVIGDFNRDDKPDIAATFDNGQPLPQSVSSVRIFLNQGNGAFVAGQSYEMPVTFYTQVCCVAAGDLNRDGKIDLVFASGSNASGREGSSSVVFSGNGDGTFGAPQSVNGGPNVPSVILSDLSRDGAPELIFANSGFHANNGGVYVVSNTGNGSFGQPTIYYGGHDVVGVASNHFTGATLPDIAAVTGDGTVAILSTSSGFGVDSTFSSGPSASAIADGDFNGDGHSDLVVVDRQDARVNVFLNTSFGPSGGSGGNVTTTPSLASSSSPYYTEEDLKVANTAPLTSLHITVTVRKTAGISYAGQYTTFPAGTVTSSHMNTGDAIVYSYDLAPGHTIPAGTYTVGSQFGGDGTYHASMDDTYMVAADAGSGAQASAGHFSALGSTPLAPSVSATGSVAAGSGPYYTEEDVNLSTAAPLTALRLTVTVRKTAGVSYAGQYTTFPAGTVTSSHTDTGDAIVYTYDLAPGHTIPAGAYTIGSQFGGDGQTHPVNQDSYSGSATSGSATSALSGQFQP